MPPEETPAPEAVQPATESPSPATETPTPAAEPGTPPAEVSPVPVESESVPSEPVPPAETSTAQAPTQTAQIPPNEPIAPGPDPIEPAPEPPPAVTSTPVPIIPVVAPQTGILHIARDLLIKARVSIQDRKRKKRDKIMLALNTKNKITNDEVEKLLHVSDATATRYLSALEKEGKIIQVGKKGKGIVYIRTP